MIIVTSVCWVSEHGTQKRGQAHQSPTNRGFIWPNRQTHGKDFNDGNRDTDSDVNLDTQNKNNRTQLITIRNSHNEGVWHTRGSKEQVMTITEA